MWSPTTKKSIKFPAGWRIYLAWLFLAGLAALPLATDKLKPFWRMLCWIGPTFLALEVDARNHRWVYIVKGILWAIMSVSALAMLNLTDGFTKESGIDIKIVWPLVFSLLAISCFVTIIGYRYKEVKWRGWYPEEKKFGHLRLVVKTTFFEEQQNQRIQSRIEEMRCQIMKDGEKDHGELLSAEEVNERVLHINKVTEYVMRRVFKRDRNQVLLYSMVTQYRASLAVLALLLAGMWHVMDQLFKTSANGASIHNEQEIIDSAILWLTLPTLTLPNLIKLYFGNVRLIDFIRGYLPASIDRDMWERLNIQPEDLYTALTNAVGHESLFQDRINLLLLRNKRPGTVKVSDLEKAKSWCAESLLQIGNYHVRVSDGRVFSKNKRGEMKAIPHARPYLSGEGDLPAEHVKIDLSNGEGAKPKDGGHDVAVVLTDEEEDMV